MAADAPPQASPVQNHSRSPNLAAEKTSNEANTAPRPNGQGKTNGAESPAGAAAAGEKSNTSPLFRASMRAAIDALIDAEAYAAKKNYSVRFTNEDLRATAISIFIAVREGYSK